MVEITLARHGETDWNRREIFRGRADIELSETGAGQAELLAKYLSQVEITAIYASPLKRSLKTAEAIASYHNLEVKTAAGLIDLDYGKWQGLPHKEVKEKYPKLYAEWLKNPQRVKMPGGESLDDVRRRALAVVDRVTEQHAGTVVLVSHRVVNKVLICALLGLDNSHFWNLKQDVGAITTFSHENDRFILTRHNDTSFLKAVPTVPLGDF
jgi:broad specificity phosphatase PhoE